MKSARPSKRHSLRLLWAPIGALLLGAPTLHAQTTDCAIVKAVMSKMENVSYHMYLLDSANTDAALHGGKPTTGEVISAGGSMYVLTHGKWVKSPVSLAEMKKSRDTTLLAKETCSHLRDESVNGEAATVWRTHMTNEMATYDTDMWISKSRGVVLKAISVTDVGGPMGKSTVSARYDYTNVRPPAGVP